jgi:hypothetical protein
LVDVKTKSGGRIPYGSITGIVQKMQHALPWLTKNMIQNRLRKLDAGQRGSQMLGSTSCRGITDGGAVLMLSPARRTADEDKSPQDNDGSRQDPILATIMPQERECSPLVERSTACNYDDDEDATIHELSEPTGRDAGLAAGTERAIHTSFGRPKGTTMVTYRDLKARVQLATAEAAAESVLVRENARRRNKRAERGTLTKIIAAAKQKHGVDTETIRNIRFGLEQQENESTLLCAKELHLQCLLPSPALSA